MSDQSSFKSVLEIVTNVTVLCLGLVMLVVFGWKWMYPAKAGPPNPYPKGSVFNEMKDLGETRHSRTLILALSTTCSYCIKSVPFYKNLLDSIGQNRDLSYCGPLS